MTPRGGIYDADIEPYVIPVPEIGGPHPQIFQIRGDLPFPSADQVIRASDAGCEIDLGVPSESGLTFDLRSVSEAMPRIRKLSITDVRSVTGWGELSGATALTSLLVLGDDGPAEPLSLADLPSLRNAGVIGEMCLSVCENPNVTSLALQLPKSRAMPVIVCPLEDMSLTSKVAHLILDRMVHPEELTSLLIVGARDFDCLSLLRLPNLEELEFQFCSGVRNVGDIARATRLRKLEFFRCRDIDDPGTAARLVEQLNGR